MIKFEKFFLEEVQRLSGVKTTSLSKIEVIGIVTNEARVKNVVSLYLFYKGYIKGTLTNMLEEKYTNWKKFEKQFKEGDNKLNSDFKILQNYKLHTNLIKKQQELVIKVYERTQNIRTKDLAEILGVSPNVASAFKRGELKRISKTKIIDNAKQILNTPL